MGFWCFFALDTAALCLLSAAYVLALDMAALGLPGATCMPDIAAPVLGAARAFYNAASNYISAPVLKILRFLLHRRLCLALARLSLL